MILPVTLPVTLTAAGAAALINFWLAMRCGQIRTAEKISVGDGGNARLIARMRAHANFGENVPLALILLGLIELATGTSIWLWLVAIIFLAGRVAHGFGMDGARSARMFGATSAGLILLGLGLYALVLPHLGVGKITPIEVTPQG